ncbi:FadR/GntR family transcriptional regulator [Dictyobacter formicarum]|uniref:HTH gntR-type domain-containing protein n=1 Tax=Dictyobacter formicarum TaxID=2778368 RepID=A0ABQ3VGI7_9CHLR|nr:GntR family transcriptional regulator [Dictyobacter formicarum]GHO85135.1 hypothetical protein KSZ_31410 [Dictyobacter formicarum]
MPTMYNRVQSSKVFEQVAEQIEQRILRGELHSGDRLPTERELCEMFQVSRTAVREAMKTLAQKGLVEMRPGRGTIVINATSRAMRQSLDLMMRVDQTTSSDNLVEVREIFEPEIAARAASRATREEIGALTAAVDSWIAHYMMPLAILPPIMSFTAYWPKPRTIPCFSC